LVSQAVVPLQSMVDVPPLTVTRASPLQLPVPEHVTVHWPASQ
jgi:hypothetical protein